MMRTTAYAQRVAVAVLVSAVALLFAGSARAGYYDVQVCTAFGLPNHAFVAGSSEAGFTTPDECLINNGSFEALGIDTPGAAYSVLYGRGGWWKARTPSPSLQIVNAYTRPDTVRVDCKLSNNGFAADYFWGQDGHNYGTQGIVYENNGCTSGVGGADGINRSFAPSRDFGWTVACHHHGGCNAPSGRLVLVRGVQLHVKENTGPLVAPASGNVWYQQGWVRSTWPATVAAGDASGVCTLGIAVDGQWLVPPYIEPARDRSSFTQCHGSQLPAVLDTTRYPNGGVSLRFGATNAAGVTSAPAKTVLVDNAPVTLQLSGRTDAPSTAGTQYVTATATAGPSGVAIACSVDGSPYQWHLGASEGIPVQGVGQHVVTCWAQNSAVDVYGHPAVSQLESLGSHRRGTVVSWRHAVALLAAAAAIAGGVAAVGGLGSGPARLRLPGSPRAWLDAYEAAAVDNPSAVCSELFSPELAQAYGRAMRGSCTTYFEQITSVSVLVRRVLQDGDTAVLELRQTVRPRDWAVVLSRRPGGWQAVDLPPGELVR